MQIAEQANNYGCPESLSSSDSSGADINHWNNSPDAGVTNEESNSVSGRLDNTECEKVTEGHMTESTELSTSCVSSISLSGMWDAAMVDYGGMKSEESKSILELSVSSQHLVLIQHPSSILQHLSLHQQACNLRDEPTQIPLVSNVKPVTESSPYNNRKSSVVNGQSPVSVQQCNAVTNEEAHLGTGESRICDEVVTIKITQTFAVVNRTKMIIWWLFFFFHISAFSLCEAQGNYCLFNCLY